MAVSDDAFWALMTFIAMAVPIIGMGAVTWYNARRFRAAQKRWDEIFGAPDE